MFVTFEGIEGSGKSTALRLLAEALRVRGCDPLCTREPGGCALGRSLRPILLDARSTGLATRAELCLFLADRAQHVAEVIRPALEAGQVVLCDRYTDSTLAYQGYGRGMDLEQLATLNTMASAALVPDLTLLLDLPVEQGLARAGRRNREEGTVLSEGRFDAESMAFHSRVREGYMALVAAEPQRFAIIDALQSPDDVALQALSALEQKIREQGRALD